MMRQVPALFGVVKYEFYAVYSLKEGGEQKCIKQEPC